MADCSVAIFSFENYYNRNITRYFKAVGLEGDYYDLTENIDFSEWLEYFATACWMNFAACAKRCQNRPKPSRGWNHTTGKYWPI